MASTIKTTLKSHAKAAYSEREKLVSQVIKKTTHDIEGRYKSGVGVRSGALRNSIQTEFPSSLQGVVFTNIHYAPFHEFGTRRAPANPALRRAVEAMRPGFIKAIDLIKAR